MTVECCDASGSRVVITANGKRWPVRSSITIMYQDFERTATANQDGSLAVSTKSVLPEIDMTLSDSCGLTYSDLQGCPLDVVVDLIDTRKKFFMTKAILVGRPSLNSETGEIRNMKLVCAAGNLRIATY